MNFDVLTISAFDKQLKRLSRKYASLKTEYAALLDALEENPVQGISLGNNCYKIRLTITSKGKGKAAGQEL